MEWLDPYDANKSNKVTTTHESNIWIREFLVGTIVLLIPTDDKNEKSRVSVSTITQIIFGRFHRAFSPGKLITIVGYDTKNEQNRSIGSWVMVQKSGQTEFVVNISAGEISDVDSLLKRPKKLCKLLLQLFSHINVHLKYLIWNLFKSTRTFTEQKVKVKIKHFKL